MYTYVDFKSTNVILMNAQTNEPGIKVIQTDNGLLVHGRLPGVTDLQATVDDEHVSIHGTHQNGLFEQAIPLKAPINSDHAIVTYHDHELRMVLPWRTQR